jgi:hypothetical protein
LGAENKRAIHPTNQREDCSHKKAAQSPAAVSARFRSKASALGERRDAPRGASPGATKRAAQMGKRGPRRRQAGRAWERFLSGGTYKLTCNKTARNQPCGCEAATKRAGRTWLRGPKCDAIPSLARGDDGLTHDVHEFRPQSANAPSFARPSETAKPRLGACLLNAVARGFEARAEGFLTILRCWFGLGHWLIRLRVRPGTESDPWPASRHCGGGRRDPIRRRPSRRRAGGTGGNRALA